MGRLGLILAGLLLSGCAKVCEFNAATALVDHKAFDAKYGDPRYYSCYTAYAVPLPPLGTPTSPVYVQRSVLP